MINSKEKAMTPNEIKAELTLKGVRNKDIAQLAGVKDGSHVTHVINGTIVKSDKIQHAIADAIGRPVSEVFPKAYAENQVVD